MPRYNHSSRSRHSYKSQPETEQSEKRPAKPFPVLYIGLMGGSLVLVSVAVTASFLFSGPIKPATTHLGNQPRTDLAPPAPSPLSEGQASVAAAATPAQSATDTQSFLLRPANLESSDATGSEAKENVLSADDVERKNSLAEMEFRAKNYAEAERIYREILPATSAQQLAAYHIYVCLLLEDRKDDAKDFLAQVGIPDDSPALPYCKATLAFVSGDSATAQSILEEARKSFPDVGAAYDPTLKVLGYLP